MIFTWGTRERQLCPWPHAACGCGSTGWVLSICYRYFTLFWIFGVCTSHAYVLVCVSCGCRLEPTETSAEIEAKIGNELPIKYRFGMAMLLTAILVGSTVGSVTTSGDSDSGYSSNGTSALSVLGFLALVAMVGYLIFFGDRSAAEVRNPGAERGDPTRRPSSRLERTCPSCAETVKFEAKICRFCGRDLPPPPSPPTEPWRGLPLAPRLPRLGDRAWKPDPTERHKYRPLGSGKS